MNNLFGDGLREEIVRVRRRISDDRFEVAVSDGNDEREMTRAQELERREQFARAFFVN